MSAADPTPDSAMATGSDAGEPGEHGTPAALGADDQLLLDELQADTGGTTDPDADAEARAAEDDAPLPADGGDPGDGLSAEFTDD